MDEYLGGKPLLYTCTISSNGLSLTTKDSLGDTGAGVYVSVNAPFAEKILRILNPHVITDFEPRPVTGYDGKGGQSINTALLVTMEIQGRTFKEIPVVIIPAQTHEVIIGKIWFQKHDVFADCKRHRLVFPPSMPPDHYSEHNLAMDDADS